MYEYHKNKLISTRKANNTVQYTHYIYIYIHIVYFIYTHGIHIYTHKINIYIVHKLQLTLFSAPLNLCIYMADIYRKSESVALT